VETNYIPTYPLFLSLDDFDLLVGIGEVENYVCDLLGVICGIRSVFTTDSFMTSLFCFCPSTDYVQY
jgi:hypothetical protein